MNINLEKAIVNAYLHHSKVNREIANLPGMSSPKVRHLLNNIVAQANSYLEIGCWKGSTLISAGYLNDATLYAMDNFSEFSQNEDVWAILKENIANYLNNRVNFSNSDFHNIRETRNFNPQNIEVYFYDGNHDEENQYDALVYMEHVLANEFILIVDDWNHEPARLGTMRAIKDLEWKLQENYALPANFNGDTDNWWHGLWVGRICK